MANSKTTQSQYPSSCFSSSFSTPQWTQDVFLCFRHEEDAAKNFAHRLYKALRQAGIHTFKRDDNELHRENQISCLQAIQESSVSIVVFSKYYADCTRCLDELEKIMDCRRRTGHKLVIPVFYDVDPSHVRRQTGSFGEALGRHEQELFDMGKLERWRAALTEAANLSGWDLRNVSHGHESKFIQKIIKTVLREVNHTCMNVASHPVGIDSRVEDVISLLSIGSEDVRKIGIYGMGGIGKTTIAKAVYNSIFYLFEGSCFLENVREVSEQPNGLFHLQEQLISEILNQKNYIGTKITRENLSSKRVLIVLDDLDQLDQLIFLSGEHHCFGSGSRIIITTRDVVLLEQVDEIYKAKELDYDESLDLFCWHAFGETTPSEDHVELSRKILAHAGGLPLALKVLGSYLWKRTIIEWKSALEKLQLIPNNEIEEILRISFDALGDDDTKSIFLDIACFFIGKNKDDTIGILNVCGFFSEMGIRVLINRCLLTVDEKKALGMHDLLRDMGRNIIREESPKEAGKRSRLWSCEEVCDVLKYHKGTEAIEGIVPVLPMSKEIHFNAATFVRMHKLRLLQIDNVHLGGSFEHVFEGLRWLGWRYCPLKSLPSNFSPQNLADLDMQDSNINTLWQGIKMLPNLKILNLSWSRFLTTTPDFTGVPNLEKLLLLHCTNLYAIHPSIGLLSRLIVLNLGYCKNLRYLPSSICNLRSLEFLYLSYCSKLEVLPEQLGNMEGLRKLNAEQTGIKQLPNSIGLLRNLTDLSLGGSHRNLPTKRWLLFFPLWKAQQIRSTIKFLPHSISSLCSLRELDLKYCNLSDGDIPDAVGNLSSLRVLFLGNNNFCSLPSSLGHLSNLEVLSVNNCSSLVSIPDLSPNIRRLHAVECTSLKKLPNLSNLKEMKELHLKDCYNLSEIQGMEDLDSISVIRMEGCRDLATTFNESFFQGFIKLARQSKMYLSRREIPVWFSHQSIGSSISFDMPLDVEEDNFLGMILWIDYQKVEFSDFDDLDVIDINNKTNGTKWSYLDFWPDKGEAQSWASHLPIRHPIKGGDRIEVSIRERGLRVDKCGIHLVYKSDTEKVKSSSNVVITEIGTDEL